MLVEGCRKNRSTNKASLGFEDIVEFAQLEVTYMFEYSCLKLICVDGVLEFWNLDTVPVLFLFFWKGCSGEQRKS
jgi:hypothetical protein